MAVVAGFARGGNEDARPLIRAYRHSGDRRTIEAIVMMHRDLLACLAGRHARVSNEAYEELMQVAHVGFTKAVKNYDERSGAGFATYAYAVVDGEIRHHLS